MGANWDIERTARKNDAKVHDVPAGLCVMEILIRGRHPGGRSEPCEAGTDADELSYYDVDRIPVEKKEQRMTSEEIRAENRKDLERAWKIFLKHHEEKDKLRDNSMEDNEDEC